MSRSFRRSWSSSVAFAWTGLVIAVSVAWAELPPGARVFRDGRWERQRQIRESVDLGDRLASPAGSVPLHRLKGAVALRLTGELPLEEVVERLSSPGGALPGYQRTSKGGCGVVVLEAARDPRGRLLPGVVDEPEPWTAAGAAAGVAWSGPVFVEPHNGLWKIPTGDLLLRLKPETDPEAYFGADWPAVSRWPGTAFHFRLPRPAASVGELLGEAARRGADPRVRWVEPDFVFQVVRTLTPNDALFSSQWYLRGTNLSGADVSSAWDRTTGATNVVIAILDDGVQLSHPDLSANIFVNSGETANGQDDDGNGYVDDLRGWDFLDADSDVNPADPLDNHGTSTAGIAAARGNNSAGIAGTAYGCRILPVKILRGDLGTSVSRTASAIRYAGGINDAGGRSWRGADVLSISLGFTGSAAVDDAFADVVRFGRGGKGCPIFVSSGNDASGWLLSGILGFPAGTYRFRWVYSKDESYSFGDDTLWLDCVVYPGGTIERFETLGLPSGWTTAGNLPWVSVQDGIQGNHAVTGWNGPGSRAIRAGRITHGQYSAVEIRRAVGSGDLTYWIWVSSEEGYDYFDLYVDGILSDSYSGVPFIQTALDYPGTHPDTMAVGASTDFAYRADYSQYGTGSNGDRLDFLAPSSGGRADVFATDRTGANGYNAGGDYVSDFGGTSASAPLAAGVGALVLAHNPELTAAEVRAILSGTADRIGGVTYVAGWHPEYGYGRIHASRAVVQARPNLVVRQSASVASLSLGETVTFTVTVTNRHPVIARSVEITEQPMAGLSFRSATLSQGSWTNAGAGVICRLGELGAGVEATLSLVFEAVSPGTGTNSAAAVSSQPDADPSDDIATTVVTVVERPWLTGVALPGGFLGLEWPTNGGSFLLESTPDLTPPALWSTVPGSPVVTGDRFTLTVLPANGTTFYRLRR